MFVYIKTDGGHLYTVGHYQRNEERLIFEPDSDHNTREEAARRVNYLNGGKGEPYDWVPADDRREPDLGPR